MNDCGPGPIVAITPPKRWSFSSIRSFNLCPLRWELSNDSSTQKKRTFTVASVEGDLLHQLIQSYFERDPAEPFRQRRALLQLIANYPEQHPEDSASVKTLVQKSSIQDILFSFIKALEIIRAEGGAEYTFRRRVSADPTVERTCHPRGAAVANGVEKWVEVTEVALCGRLDYYIDGVLMDFKSGAVHDWHQEQVIFYCALIRKKFGHPPRRAKVYYTGSGVSVEVPVPNQDECEAILVRYAYMATAASDMLRSGKVAALPERETCSFCPCKPNCEEYWQVIVPQLLQDPNLSVVDAVVPGDATVTSSAAYLAVNFTASYGSVEILFPRHTHPNIAAHDLMACRVLRARKRQNGTLISVVLNEQSEVFWPRKAYNCI